jgi:transcriptional regulator with XRE-family HTH domain
VIGAAAMLNDDARTDDPIAHALSEVLGERSITPQGLDARAGLAAGSTQAIVDGDAEPSEVELEKLARALGVEPSFFFEYRLRVVLATLGGDVERLNGAFQRSLKPFERAAIEGDRIFDEQLASAVSRLLAEQGLTQGELADSLGLSQGYVSRLLRERSPSQELLESLALGLNVDPHAFREYRLLVVRDALEGDRPQLNTLFDQFGDPLRLAPYVSWRARSVPPPEEMEPADLLRVLLEIIRTEGPVMGRRVYSALLAAAQCEFTHERRSRLNKAVSALVRKRYVVADNETREPGQIHVVLRHPGTPNVVPRRRGPRWVVELPLRELVKVAKAAVMARGQGTVDELQETLCVLYEAEHPEPNEREHMNRAIAHALRRG